MTANIYFDNYAQPSYCGEGSYILVSSEDFVVAQHFCSNRGWAELDLTTRIKEILKQHNITEVYSNDRLVWQKTRRKNNGKN